MIIDFEGKKVETYSLDSIKILNSPNSSEMEFNIILSLAIHMYGKMYGLSLIDAEQGIADILTTHIKVLLTAIEEE